MQCLIVPFVTPFVIPSLNNNLLEAFLDDHLGAKILSDTKHRNDVVHTQACATHYTVWSLNMEHEHAHGAWSMEHG